jgi:hypothetical protein
MEDSHTSRSGTHLTCGGLISGGGGEGGAAEHSRSRSQDLRSGPTRRTQLVAHMRRGMHAEQQHAMRHVHEQQGSRSVDECLAARAAWTHCMLRGPH